MDNEGVAVGNDYTTFRSNMKVNAKVTNWFEVGANVNFQERTDGDTTVDWGKQITENSPFASYRNEMENWSAFRWEMFQEIRGTTMITDNNLRNVSRVIQYLILF